MMNSNDRGVIHLVCMHKEEGGSSNSVCHPYKGGGGSHI